MKPYSENRKLKVIEMLAGPGAGKSTAALFLAAHMKARGYKVEYGREIAKDLIWDARQDMFTEQDYILALQNNLLRRMTAHDIDYVILDTSILLGLIYRAKWYPTSFDQYLLDVHKSYTNITFYVDRGDIPYVEAGRNEDRNEALDVDDVSITMLRNCSISYTTVQQKNGVYDHAALQMLTHIQSMEATQFAGTLALGGRNA